MSRYQLFRRRVAPFAFLLAMGLLIRESCQGAERTHATILLVLGEAEPRVRALDAELLVDGEVVGVLHRVAPPGLRIGTARFEVTMPRREGELRIDVDLGDHKRQLVRTIRAEEGATIEVPLADDLR